MRVHNILFGLGCTPSRISGNSYFKGSCRAVVCLFWTSYTTAIQHYSWEDLGAGDGIEQSSPAWGDRTSGFRCRWPKQNISGRNRTQDLPTTGCTNHSTKCVLHIQETGPYVSPSLNSPLLMQWWAQQQRQVLAPHPCTVRRSFWLHYNPAKCHT